MKDGDDIKEKLFALEKYISALNKVVVAYSGGVDSTVVAKVATMQLGKNAFTVIANSASLPRRELQAARKLAKEHSLMLKEMNTGEMNNLEYTKNNVMRCYFCKNELYSHLVELQKKFRFQAVLDGSNASDKADYRPGRKAALQWQVLSPLAELGITKVQVRALAKMLGLPNHEKPASPCLSSRIPHGISVTSKRLEMVEKAEAYLLDNFPINTLRVRFTMNNEVVSGTNNNNAVARIEVPKPQITILENNWDTIVGKFLEIGFAETVIERDGFLSGRLTKKLSAMDKPSS